MPTSAENGTCRRAKLKRGRELGGAQSRPVFRRVRAAKGARGAGGNRRGGNARVALARARSRSDLAALFSRGETDAFWVAFTLPNALRSCSAKGRRRARWFRCSPRCSAEEGDDAARALFCRDARRVASRACRRDRARMSAAPWLVELFAGGLHARPGAFERTVLLTRWVFPYIFFMGTAALGMAALNTYGRFAAAAFAPGLLNVAFIVAALALPGWFIARGADPILALAVGALAGGALQVVAQWPSLARIGFRLAAALGFRDRRVRQALGRMVPMMAGIGIYTDRSRCSRGGFSPSCPKGRRAISRGPCASAIFRRGSSFWHCKRRRCRRSPSWSQLVSSMRWQRRTRTACACRFSWRFRRPRSSWAWRAPWW